MRAEPIATHWRCRKSSNRHKDWALIHAAECQPCSCLLHMPEVDLVREGRDCDEIQICLREDARRIGGDD